MMSDTIKETLLPEKYFVDEIKPIARVMAPAIIL